MPEMSTHGHCRACGTWRPLNQSQECEECVLDQKHQMDPEPPSLSPSDPTNPVVDTAPMDWNKALAVQEELMNLLLFLRNNPSGLTVSEFELLFSIENLFRLLNRLTNNRVSGITHDPF